MRKMVFELLCAPLFTQHRESSALDLNLSHSWTTGARPCADYIPVLTPSFKQDGKFVEEINIAEELLKITRGPKISVSMCLGVLELVRNLLNVSCQFRLELAKVLWDRVDANIDVYGGCYLHYDITTFFKERPKIHSSIHSLSLQLWDDGLGSEYVPAASSGYCNSTTKFIHICDYISGNLLNIKHLHLNIDTSLSRYMDRLTYQDSKYTWLRTAIRSIPVSNTFKLSFRTTLWAKEKNRHKQFKEQDLQSITEWLIPESLETPDPSTLSELDRYLLSRAGGDRTARSGIVLGED